MYYEWPHIISCVELFSCVYASNVNVKCQGGGGAKVASPQLSGGLRYRWEVRPEEWGEDRRRPLGLPKPAGVCVCVC